MLRSVAGGDAGVGGADGGAGGGVQLGVGDDLTWLLRSRSKWQTASLILVPFWRKGVLGWGRFSTSKRSVKIIASQSVLDVFGISQSCRKDSTVSEVQKARVFGI